MLDKYTDATILIADFIAAMQNPQEGGFRDGLIAIFQQGPEAIITAATNDSTKPVLSNGKEFMPWRNTVEFNGGWATPLAVAQKVRQLMDESP